MTNSVFGERLKKIRTDSGMSQVDLADRLNKDFGLSINKSLISRYENGIHAPRFSLVTQLSGIFKVSPDYLTGITDDPYGKSIIKIDMKRVPLLGTVRAGEPLYILEEHNEFELTNNQQVDFALRITGDSMIGARIYKGDIVFVRHQDDVDNGDIAVVVVGGDSATLKRIYKQKGKIILHPENPSMEDMVYSKNDMENVRIIGKVMEVKFDVR